MADARRHVGSEGEREAERFLHARGYAILARNYRCRYGEVDLIALHRGTVVFVEVKTRRRAPDGAGFDAVDLRKQRQISRAAEHYLTTNRLSERPVRFDVVAVCADAGGRFTCEVMQDAFDPYGVD